MRLFVAMIGLVFSTFSFGEIIKSQEGAYIDVYSGGDLAKQDSAYLTEQNTIRYQGGNFKGCIISGPGIPVIISPGYYANITARIEAKVILAIS